MGASSSREGLEISNSETDEDETYDEEEKDYRTPTKSPAPTSLSSSSSLDDIDAKLKSLKLKYSLNPTSTPPLQNPNLRNTLKLYLHIGGNTPKAKWVTSEKLTTYTFLKTSNLDDQDDDEEDGDEDNMKWVLKIGSKVRALVSTEMQLKMFGDQRRVDFASRGVWAVKFFTDEDYRSFVSRYQDCLFENT